MLTFTALFAGSWILGAVPAPQEMLPDAMDYAPHAYDAVRALAYALDAANYAADGIAEDLLATVHQDSAAVFAALANVSFHGMSGHVAWDSNWQREGANTSFALDNYYLMSNGSVAFKTVASWSPEDGNMRLMANPAIVWSDSNLQYPQVYIYACIYMFKCI